MNRSRVCRAALAAAALGMPALVSAEVFTEALRGGTAFGDVRVRYERVDDEALRTADALTVRTRIGYATASWAGASATLEFVDVRPMFGVNDYQYPGGPNADRAVIADQKITEVNQAFVEYAGVDGLQLRLGRQRIIYDDARFIGNVGWRQNEQTFDAVSLAYTGLENLSFTYAHVDAVRGIGLAEAFSYDSSDHLARLEYRPGSFAGLVGYAYLLKNEETGNSTDTFGARLSGNLARGDIAARYALAYGRQTAERGSEEFSAHHVHAEVEAAYGDYALRAGYEVLGSDSGLFGFDTPYATKHAFNGWADMFLQTPGAGLRDAYLVGTAGLAGASITAAYHRYRSDRGSMDYGREWNLQATRGFGVYRTGIKYARYSARSHARDVGKLWLWVELAF